MCKMHVGYIPSNSFYIFRLHLFRHAAQSLFNFPTKCYVFHNFIFFCSNNIYVLYEAHANI